MPKDETVNTYVPTRVVAGTLPPQAILAQLTELAKKATLVEIDQSRHKAIHLSAPTG
jgi:hypothetical protein